MRSALLLASLTLAWLTGCFQPIQVTVPDDFHGAVMIVCVSTVGVTRQAVADSRGHAQATCPPVQPTIQVMRSGRLVNIVGEPMWQRSKEGELKSVQFHID